MFTIFRTAVVLILIITAGFIFSETLFQVKDSTDRVVLDVSTDGLRVLNQGDTVMVISASDVKVNLSNSKDKVLSRTFSVTTATSKKGFANVLEVGTQSTTMREGLLGEKYTDFSPVNIFIGLNSGINTVPSEFYGYKNVFLGNNSGLSNLYGYKNVFIGDEAGMSIQGNTYSDMGSNNVFIGTGAGRNTTGSVANIAIGVNAGAQGGYLNTFVGNSSGQKQTGWRNAFFGYHAGQNSTTGDNNTCIGSSAGEYLSTGMGNTIIGQESGFYTYYANKNILIGNSTGRSLRYDQNVVIGYQAGYNLQYSTGNLLLGYQAGYNETGSDKLYIANSNTTTPLIKGTFPNTDLTFTANRVDLVHPSGTSNGLYILNNYQGNTDSWHFYQYTTKELALFYNTAKRGDFNITTGAYTHVSDKRLKKNIENYEGILNKLMQIEPKRYNFNEQKNGDKKFVGLLAQDVEELFPEFVYYTEEDDTYTMDYAGLSVVAIQAIKEQQAEIEELKAQIKEIKELIGK